MPIDPGKLRRVTEHNDRIIEEVKELGRQLDTLDANGCEQTSTFARAWAQIAHELKVNIQEQQQLSKAMRESARIQDEQHGESYRDKYKFVVDRLKVDIRYAFTSLHEFVDLHQDFARSRTWDHAIYDMEMDLKSISAASAGENSLTSVDPLVMLLNYRDQINSLMLSGLLFQKAVLDWDLRSQRAFADGPMVEMAEQVVNIYSKTESLPAKLRVRDLPSARDPGPFTLDRRWLLEPGYHSTELSQMQCRLLTTIREMQSLDEGLRHMSFAEQVFISDKHSKTGKNAALDELRKELTKWYEKASRLEQELQSSRAQRHTPLEVQVEQLNLKLAEKDQQNKQHVTRVHKLEGDVQSLKYDLANLRQEKNDLADKNQRMSKETLPILDKLNCLLSKSCEAVDRMSSDSMRLSSTFRQQVQEVNNMESEKEELFLELNRLQRHLKHERSRHLVTEQALQKKETLYLRTMAARKSIHESCLEQKQQIQQVEDMIRQREADWQEMLKVIEGRDAEIQQLNEDLRRAQMRISELEEQKSACMQAFQTQTGRPPRSLLQRFRPVPTLPNSALDTNS